MPKEANQREALLIQPDGTIIHMLTDITYPEINNTLGVKWIEAIYAVGVRSGRAAHPV